MPAHAAIQYSRESFDLRSGGDVMGRRVAGETFLKAWIAHGEPDPLTAWVHSAADGSHFREHARELGATGELAVASVNNFAPLEAAGALWLADPGLGARAWERRWFRQDAWSLIGITHTISSDRAFDRIADLLTAPIQPWDALICTSRAVRKVVQTLFEQQAQYLRARIGATACTGPELPVIPLGVDCASLAPDPAARARWRTELGIAEGDVAILQFGRISFHLKAHPLPLMLAMQRAAAQGAPRLHLILAGQPTNPKQGEKVRAMAAGFADSFVTHFVDGARLDAGSVRSAADVFTLLSDNIQESFGLAPVEAMAAGLPVVGSDWDGLRDTILPGETGLLVDTILPPAGAGEQIARRFALSQEDYHHFLGNVAQVTAVDVDQAGKAFATLAADPELRRRMGAAGQKRALATYDWRQVIGGYRSLLDHLAQIRATGPERARRAGGAAHYPARMDPFQLFASYPSATLGKATLLIAAGPMRRIADIPGGRELAAIVPGALPPDALLDALVAKAVDPIMLEDLLAAFPGEDRRRLTNTVAFLMKIGLLARA
jgi:glycosyltransferase involved in cell wall biosynthesis